jgi:indole-3-glycerol phosphate synthase
MNKLEEIVAHKRVEVAEARQEVPVKKLEKSIYFSGPVLSLSSYLARPEMAGIIAEIKRRSPSEGDLHPYLSVRELSLGYMQAGASALSVLTDTRYFGGKREDLLEARKNNLCPILRKEFTIDEYQIIEARSLGADAILLIAGALTPDEVRVLATAANNLGLESILEVHCAQEVDSHLCDEVSIIGVNNRDLRDLSVDVGRSEAIARVLPKEKPWISESGLTDVETIRNLRRLGYSGFLIGTTFLKTDRPDEECARFVHALKQGR